MPLSVIVSNKEMEDGLIDADLGGHVYKKRAAIEGQGKSGGLRTILAFKVGNKSFFMFGFAKNQRANVDAKELKALKKMAKELLGYSASVLNKALDAGNFIEVKKDEK
ncbi:MAG: type II toxin-antitoxin system RelE/ParE family toxin [Colwellia sp.]|nr:type II toxin-antitoxin system RelE/ParE family toxin [Colwellia sp.]